MIFDPFELNYTKVKSYLDCPYLYKYRYIDRRFPPHTPFSSLGISVHRALDRYHSSGGDLEALFFYYDEGWHNQGFETPQQCMEFYNRGRKILENYRSAELAARDSEIVFTEKDFEFELEKWRVKGSIDRVDKIDGGYEIIDYKMGFEGKTEAELRNDLQLAIYALGLKKDFNMEPLRLSWFLMVKGEKISIPYDPGTAEAVLAVLKDTGEKILELDLSRKGNCAVCAIRNLCSESCLKADNA